MEPHAIIGILLFIILFFQAPLGYLHHKRFVATGRRTVYSHLHLGIGRLMIPLGIINGILGVQLTDGATWKMVVIGLVGGSMWLLYMIAIIVGEWRRSQKIQHNKRSANGSPLNRSPKDSGLSTPATPSTPSTPRDPPRYDLTMSHGYDNRRYISGRPRAYHNGYSNLY
jgi:hypothetical protein